MMSSEDDTSAKITVLAAGDAGNRIANRLGRLFADIECLADPTPLDVVSPTVAQSDMIVIVSGLENEAVVRRATVIAEVAREAAPCRLVIAFVTKSSADRSAGTEEGLATLRRTVHALCQVSRDCLVPVDENAQEVMTASTLEEHLVRLVVADIVRMIIERGLICIDFSDLKAILGDGGSDACVGIGIAGGEGGAREAAMKALRALRRQHMEPTRSPAVLASVTGSTNMTMDDFDDASRVIHESIDEDANIIVGVLIDDALAGNIRVLVIGKRAGGPSGQKRMAKFPPFTLIENGPGTK
jgi:cell division protein FtsZ